MKQDTVAPQDQADHELGLEIIRVLGLKRKRDNGRVETTHGDKNPCGLARTLRHLSASPLEKHAGTIKEHLERMIHITSHPKATRSQIKFIANDARELLASIEKPNPSQAH